MDKNKIIIVILIIVVVILAAAMAAMMLPSLNAQKDSKIAIVSNKTLYEGDNLTVKLTDLNKTPIKKEFVNVTVVDKDGKVVVNKSIKTDSKGKATFKLKLDAGNYTVNASFSGNENFTGNTTSKKITIKEEVVESQPSQSSSASQSQSSSYPSGLTDEEIDAYIQRDLNERAKNGVEGAYDYQGAKEFYRNVPPEGMK